jgi:hypothetical protein
MAAGLFHKSDQANQAIIEPGQQQVVNDCQNVALSWLASQLGPEKANTVLRNLISCKVNRGGHFSSSSKMLVFALAVRVRNQALLNMQLL